MHAEWTPTQRCSSCDGEFKMHVESCPDCGTTLIASQGFADADGPPPEGYALGPDDLTLQDDVMPLGVSGEPMEVRRVSVRLSHQRIRHWLIPRDLDDPLAAYNKPMNYMDIYVPKDQLDAAAEVVRGLYWGQDGVPEGLDLDAALADSSTCPACATELPETDVEECPECGLLVGG